MATGGGEGRKEKKKVTQALMHTALRAHTSAAMHALTQLTQAGVSVSCDVKALACSGGSIKNVSVPKQKGSEGSGLLCFPVFIFLGPAVFRCRESCFFIKDSRVQKEESADSCC